MPREPSPLERLVQYYREHPGRGGCGIGAIADPSGPSHELIELALRGLGCMEHRGGSIDDTGDGAGLLFNVERSFFEPFVAPGRRLPEGDRLSVGSVFFPRGERSNLRPTQQEIDGVLRRAGLAPLGWRLVPTNPSVLGKKARIGRREVWQVLVSEGMVPEQDLKSVFWKAKANIENSFRDIYLPSFSPRTVVYKALATGPQLVEYYGDLKDPRLATDLCLFHRRYSTNTFSNWYLAQAFRVLAHNGEINTIKANRFAVKNLQRELGLYDVLMRQGSDSADLDRVVELFLSHGVSLMETLVRLMPAAWQDWPDLDPAVVRYLKGVQRALGTLGAWEGPAGIVATDGELLVGALDRMGLRPLRWVRTHSGRVILASEIGAVALPSAEIAEVGQLDPGEAVALDMRTKTWLAPREVFARVVKGTRINFPELADQQLFEPPPPEVEIPAHQEKWLALFGWGPDRVKTVRFMAENAKEPIVGMGNDRPLAVFSKGRPTLFKYFKQIVAVVTNPPLDPIREGTAFDLTMYLGAKPQAHEWQPTYRVFPQWRLLSPLLTPGQLHAIREGGEGKPLVCELDATFEDTGSAKGMTARIAEMARLAVSAVKTGRASVLIVSDHRATRTGDTNERLEPFMSPVSPRVPVPTLLAAAAVHNALVEEGIRRRASIVVESGEVSEGHDAAVLMANGADAVCPYLYFQLAASPNKNLPPPAGAVLSAKKAIDSTLVRVMSKMGITSVDGYRGSRLFEAVGISADLVDHYLPGVVSRVGGIDIEDIYADAVERMGHDQPRVKVDLTAYRKEVWRDLQLVARGTDPGAYARFIQVVESSPPVYLRDLLTFRSEPEPRPVDEVEAPEFIIKRAFRGAAMSHGALHGIAHRAIAAAFNSFGSMSNSGEGGEDTRRNRGGMWEESRSRIRQIASARFGADAVYMVNADELEIKIGQGAKPGEGGHLPAEKVTEEIARIRKTRMGIALISPPPHHDIYSIEDLAQLIHNLRQANPRARIAVKLPTVTDLGTIAVGVAKAGADVISISGFEGGTGAASASSIEHAGLPLERGLSEVHQALCINGIRDRVLLRADGGLKTGADVIKIIALGADELSFGGALMIAEQCVMCHGCSNGQCPAGITTQDEHVAERLMRPKGRDRGLSPFSARGLSPLPVVGKRGLSPLPVAADPLEAAEERYREAMRGVRNYLLALAGEVRQLLAGMGLRSTDELVGRVDLLAQRKVGDARADKVDLSDLLVDVTVYGGARKGKRRPIWRGGVGELNRQLLEAVAQAGAGEPIAVDFPITTADHALGATLSGAIASGAVRAPRGGITVRLHGYAGQALGFALVDGLRIELTGYANDTVGECMSGGRIVIRQPEDSARTGNSALGNAACYGATGGTLYASGRAGQRLGVRNSEAVIVTEGAGKYAFEYMTGGEAVVLGPVGPVVCSGMTGGVVYLWDPDGSAAKKIHKDSRIVALAPGDGERLRELVLDFQRETGSARAAEILARWEDALPEFIKVVPAT